MPKPPRPSPFRPEPRRRRDGLRGDPLCRAPTQAPVYLRSPAGAEELSSVIGHVYDAALDPALWPSVLEEICAFVPGSMGNIFSQDMINQRASRYFTWGGDPRYLDLYLERYAKLNPVFPKGMSIPVGEVMSQTDIISHADYRRTRFYEEWAKPQGYIDFVGINIEKVATSVASLAIVRHERDGFVDAATRRRMRLIAPHVRRAVLIGKVIDLQKVEAKAFAETIDGLATSVFLVGGEGALVHANQSGQAMLDAEDPLELVHGALVATDERAHRLIRDAFTAATGGDSTVATSGIAVTLAGRDGDHFIAHVLPLTAGARREAGLTHSAAAALFVRKAGVDLPATIEAATKLYRLTPAEVRVLRGVIDVGGIAPVAAMLGTAKGTVKAHLQHLFEKTGARRQAELVKLISGFDSPARRPKKE